MCGSIAFAGAMAALFPSLRWFLCPVFLVMFKQQDFEK